MQKPAAAPPPFLFRWVVRLRNFLLRVADRLVPAPIATFERLAGFFNLYAIHACAKLRLADLVDDGPRSAAELARASGASEEYLHRLLRMLSSVGVFELRADGKFAQNRLSATLREHAPDSMRPLALFTGTPFHNRAWERFVENVKSGQNAFAATHATDLWGYLNQHPDDARNFNDAMVSLTKIDAPALAAAYPFGGKRVCDIAGGHGTLLATILAKHPSARGVLFDAENVVTGAPPLLERFGVASRCETVAGNFFEKVPSGCDIYLLKDILHDWNDEQALSILKTLRASMAPGARLLIAEMVMGREHERFPGNLLDLEMMVITNDGKQRSEEQFHALLSRANLRLLRVIAVASPTSLVEAEAV